MRRASREGFTLVELIVAMTITVGMLLAARMMFEQITAAGTALTQRAFGRDSAADTDAQLGALVRNIDRSAVGIDSVARTDAADSTTAFVGEPNVAHFTSWCVDSASRARCRVVVSIDHDLTVVTGRQKLVVPSTERGSLRYLHSARDGGQWYRSWPASGQIPLALGVLRGRDTTVLPTGPEE